MSSTHARGALWAIFHAARRPRFAMLLATLAVVGCGGEPAPKPEPAPSAAPSAAPAATAKGAATSTASTAAATYSAVSKTAASNAAAPKAAATAGSAAAKTAPAASGAATADVVPWKIPTQTLRPPVAEAGQRIVGKFRAALAVAPERYRTVAWSPDGAWLATYGGAEVKIWSPRTGKLQTSFPSAASSLEFHPRDSLLAVGASGKVTLRAVPSGKLVKTLAEGGDTAVLAFSADGGRLVGGDYCHLTSWDLATGKKKRIESEDANCMENIAVSPDGKRIATISLRKGVVIWKGDSLEVERKIPAQKETVQGLAFSPDGKLLTIGGARDALRTFDAATGELKHEVKLGDDTARHMHYAPQGGMVAIGGNNLTLADPAARIYGEVMRSDRGGFLYGLEFGPGGLAVATAESRDDHVKLFDLETSREHRTTPTARVKDDEPKAAELFLFAGGKEGLLRPARGKLRVVDLSTGKTLRTIGDVSDYSDPPPVAASADGKAVYVGGKEASIEALAGATDAPPRKIAAALRNPKALAVSADGKSLAAAGSFEYKEGAVGVLDAESGKAAWTAPGHQGEVVCLAFSPDGTRLASGGLDSTVIVWDVAQGVPLHRILAHEGLVQSAVFSPDGAILATVGSEMDHVVALWNVADGSRRALLEGHVGPIASALFSPDGRLLVSAGADRRLHVWDVASAKPLHTLAGMDKPVVQLSKSLEGDSLVALAEDGTAKWWKFADLVAPPEAGLELVQTAPPAGVDVAAAFSGSIATWGYNVSAAALSPDGARMAMVESYRPQITIYDAAPYRDAARPDHRPAASFPVPSFDGNTRLMPEPLIQFVRQPGKIIQLAFSPDRKALLAVVERGEGSALRGFEADTGKLLFEAAGLPKRGSLATRAVLSPDGALVAVWSPGYTPTPLQVHDARTGEKKFGTSYGVTDALFAADGALIVAAQKTLHFLDPATGKEKRKKEEFDTELLGGVGATADGKTLAVSAVTSARPTLFHLFELPSGKPIRTVGPLTDASYFCSITPDGRFVAGRERMRDDDWEVRWLDAKSGSPYRSLPYEMEPPRFTTGGDVLWSPGPGFGLPLKVWSARDLFDDALQAKLLPLTKTLPWTESHRRRNVDGRTPSERGLELRRDGEYLVAHLPIQGRISQEVAARLAETGLPVKFDFTHSSALSAATLAGLGGRPNVRGLLLKGMEANDDAAAEAAAKLVGLEELWMPSGQASKAWVQALASFPQLRTLRGADAKVSFDDAGLEAVAALGKLEILDLYAGSGATDDGLAAIGDMKSLRELRLRVGGGVTPKGLLGLDGLANLEFLEVEPYTEVDAGLASLADLPKLETLQLTSNQATDATLEHAAKAKKLKRLRLKETAATGAGLSHWKGTKTLEEFLVVGDSFTGEGLEHLAGNKQLQRLDLRRVKLTPQGCASLGKLKPLRILRMPKGMTDEGLAALGGLASLQEFEAEDSTATGPGFKAFASMPKLEALVLEDCKATDAALVHLAGLAQLRVLKLSGSEVTDAGAAHLEKLERLEELDLSKSKLTAAGVRRLAKMKSLRTLILRDVKVGDGVLEDVKKTFPNVHISRW